MQYNKEKNGNYKELSQKNVDTGMGVERTLTVLLNLEDNYESPVLKPIILQMLLKKQQDSQDPQTVASLTQGVLVNVRRNF
jgi:alanyl-tRNA synthetase